MVSGRALIVSVKIYFLKKIYANIRYMECALVITDAVGHANIQDVLTSNAQKYALCFAQEGGDSAGDHNCTTYLFCHLIFWCDQSLHDK